MIIGLDATRLHLPTGEGTYTREVVLHLIKNHPEDQFVVIVPGFQEIFDFPNTKQVIYRRVDGIAARIQYAFYIGFFCRRHKTDVFHNLTNYIAFNTGCPVVTTIHDLASLKFPDIRLNRLHWFIYKFIFPKLLSLSDCLVAISQSTANDIEQYYKLGDRTSVVYNGIDHDRFNTKQERFSEKFPIDLPDQYLLFVGYITPKKNLSVILPALKSILQSGHLIKLVLVGKRGYGSESFFSLVEEMNLGESIIETGFVTDEQLTHIYQNATAFIFPSLYEGFGLPIVEAMACGTPVIASDILPHRELITDSFFLCDPKESKCWTRTIMKLLRNVNIREEIRQKNIDKAKMFSWHSTSKQIRAIYAGLVEN